MAELDQDTRNYVGKKLLELTLKELFVLRFMQVCSKPPFLLSLDIHFEQIMSSLLSIDESDAYKHLL